VGRSRLGLVLLAAALVALTALSGCDAGRPPAAKVGQTEVSADTLFDDLAAEAARARATESTESPQRDVEDTWSAAAAAELLGRRIRYELLGEVLRARDISVTGEERDLAEESLCQGGAEAEVPEGECPGLEGYPLSYRRFQIELAARGNAYQAAIGREGGEEAARERFDELLEEDPDQLLVQCYLGASIPDAGAVDQIQVAVAGGQSFADAIAAIDGATANPDPLCDPASLIPEEVTSAEPGTVLGPFNNQGGAFVVQVQERREGTFEEVSALLQQQLAGEQQDDAVEELLSGADVSVDPRFGRWDRPNGTVVPPNGPTRATSTSVPGDAPAP
jgi:hypothetical protein